MAHDPRDNSIPAKTDLPSYLREALPLHLPQAVHQCVALSSRHTAALMAGRF